MAPPVIYLELGEKYTCPSWQFRRYNYFHCRLEDFLPRFQRIIENGGLTDSFTDGRQMKKAIDQHSLEFSNTVPVHVLGHVSSLRLPDSLIVSGAHAPSTPCKEVDTSAESLQTRTPMETDEPVSKTSELLYRREDSIPKLSQETSSWTEFKTAMSGASSYRASFAVFVVSSQQEEQDVISLSTSLPSEQKNSVIIFSTVENRCYLFHKDGTDSLQPTYMALAETIQRMLEVKIMALFDNITTFLEKFKLREGCRLDDRLSYILDSSLRQSLMDEHTLLDIIPSVMDDLSVTEIKEKQVDLDHNLTEFVKRKTRSTLVLNLAPENGISQDFVLEFFNEGYFELDQEISDVLDEVSKPQLEEVKDRGSNRWKFREFVQQFIWKASKIIEKAEKYIQDKLQYFKKVEKLAFELYGILQMSSVPIETVIPVLPTISLECQCKILEIPEILACGHLYGKLTLFLSKPLSSPSQVEIEFLLKEYKYTYGYTTVESSTSEQGKGFDPIAGGHLLLGEKLNADNSSNTDVTFSLGCFVNIKSANGSATSEIYAISCGHCLEGCVDQVYQGDSKAEFGRKTFLMNKYHFYDIVAIQVTSSVWKECTGLLYQSEGVNGVPWNIMKNDQPLVRQEVYKHGSKSKYTKGIVVSTDTLHKAVAENIERLSSKEAAGNSNASVCQILVEPEVDDTTDNRFSDNGDSGSAICMQDPNTNTVLVVALLIGEYLHEADKKYICSYGSNFATLIEELEKEYKIEVTPRS